MNLAQAVVEAYKRKWSYINNFSVTIGFAPIKRKCVESFSKYKDEKCERVCDFPSEFLMPVSNRSDWVPAKKAKFEGLEVSIPNNYDKILTMDFNDYMQLPPEESRFNPAPEEIDFGEY